MPTRPVKNLMVSHARSGQRCKFPHVLSTSSGLIILCSEVQVHRCANYQFWFYHYVEKDVGSHMC